jgi:hypothetical protein
MGFAALTLSGPILAILSVALSLGVVVLAFAALGFIIWLPFRILAVGHQVAMENMRDVGHGLGRAGRQMVRVASFPARMLGRLVAGVFHLAIATVVKAFSAARFLSEVAVVAAAGALVGALVGVTNGTPGHDLDVVIATNAIAGGVIGALVGGVMTFRERRAVLAHPQHVAMS